MPNESFPVAKPNLAFAKIVANPTSLAWAQVYNAGSLFAGLSLTLPEPNEEISLQAIGRDTLNSLEAEFFSLEEKSLRSIQDAIITSLQKMPDTVTPNLCLAYFKDSILYLCIFGAGKVSIKRDENIGTLIEEKTNTKKLLSASGLLQNGDIILLQTEHFAQNIPEEIIKKAFELNLPSDIAETLSPHIHEKEDGGAAAIIISYQGTSAQQLAHPLPALEHHEPSTHYTPLYSQNAPIESDAFDESEAEVGKALHSKKKFKFPTFVLLKRFNPKMKLPLNKLNTTQKIIAAVAILLVIILIASVIMTKMKQQNTQLSLLFQQTYTPAKKSYDEGKALQNLNQNLAHEDFQKADQTIKTNLTKFPSNSQEAIKLQSLLTQVDAELGGATTATPDANKIPSKEATVNDNDMLSIEKNADKTVVALNQDNTSIYTLSDKTITAYDKTSGQKKDIIKNNNDWSTPLSLAPYQGNLYLLDKTKGILKYVSGSGGFGKTIYFKDPAPDVSTAKSLAIDSSIYILMQNGTILKYTKGQPDTFSISGLDKPLSSPTKIFTTKDIDNIYILDQGNSRIVKLNKDGSFQAKYTSDIIAQAKDFEIDIQNQQALVLANGKIYQIPIK